jgi:Peptidase family M23
MQLRPRHWPLPGIERGLPPEGSPGSFWEDRGDRRHAGVDLYAPAGSPVVAIEDGTVISTGVFTSAGPVPYWNQTYQVIIAHTSGIFCRYAELGDIFTGPGVPVSGGEVIGHVGTVLDPARIGAGSPPYIRSLKEQGRGSMLHLEVYDAVPGPSQDYLGGNWFTRERPARLLDPAILLGDIA